MSRATYANRNHSTVQIPLPYHVWADIGTDALTPAYGGFSDPTFKAAGAAVVATETRTHALQCQLQLPTFHAYAGGVDSDAGEATSDANITLVVVCRVTASSGTSEQIDAIAKIENGDGTTKGTPGDIVTTSAQSLSTSFASYSFALNCASNVAQHDIINICIRAVINDGGGSGGAQFEFSHAYIVMNGRL